MESLIIFIVVMLISSMLTPKKRKDTRNTTGPKTNQPATQTKRKKKSMFQQLEDEINELNKRNKKPNTKQEVYRNQTKSKSFKEEVADLIKSKEESVNKPKPFLEDRFDYYNPEPTAEEIPAVVQEIKKSTAIDLKKAIIMSEILDKPVYLRGKR